MEQGSVGGDQIFQEASKASSLKQGVEDALGEGRGKRIDTFGLKTSQGVTMGGDSGCSYPLLSMCEPSSRELMLHRGEALLLTRRETIFLPNSTVRDAMNVYNKRACGGRAKGQSY